VNEIERLFLKRIIREEVRNYYNYNYHPITNLYAIIRKECEEFFSEDNAPTLDDTLRRWFELTQFENLYPLMEKRVELQKIKIWKESIK
jgi:hypothetical protein